MKEILNYLPQLLQTLPQLGSSLKYIIILLIVVGVGYGIYQLIINYKDPYMCVQNELYKRVSIDSKVYIFEGGYCVQGK
jgi:hypothetical protein